MPNTLRFPPVAFLLFLPIWVLAAGMSPEGFLKGGTVLAAASPQAAPGPVKSSKPAQPAMDTNKVHEIYLEGDFDQAIRSLDGQIKSRRPMTHQESVFVYKHLGVMYAAQQSTRDKGKFYMSELINIEPTAKILDMYASDMIHLIFRNVQEEFEVKRARLAPVPEPAPAAQAPAAPAPTPVAETKKPTRNKRNFYLAAAGAGVAVGAFTLFMVLSSDEPETHTIHVNE